MGREKFKKIQENREEIVPYCHRALFSVHLLKPLNLTERKTPRSAGLTQFSLENQITHSTYSKLLPNAKRMGICL